MLRWFLRRQVAAFERTYGYDADYIRDIIDADTRAAMAFARASGLGRYRRGVPAEASYAAGIAVTMAEDCGPCTQLAVTMAEREGCDPDQLRAILARNVGAMSPDVSLGYRFAEAVLCHDPAADELRDQILQRWGRRGLVSLSFAIAAGRLFPTVKYALGHGRACTRVTVGGIPAAISAQQREAA